MGGDMTEPVNSPSPSTDSNIEVRPCKDYLFFENYYQNLFVTSGSMGIDLHAYLIDKIYDGITLKPGDQRIINTDIRFKFPPRLYGLIKDRSSIAMKGISTKGGVIDNDYIGEIKVILYNHGTKPFQIDHGDKIAQLVIMKYPKFKISKSKNLNPFPNTERGTRGFGDAEPLYWNEERMQQWLQRQRDWDNLHETYLIEELLKIQSLEKWKEFVREHNLENTIIIPPWFQDNDDEIQYDAPLADAQQIQNENFKQETEKRLFKDFNEKANLENENMLHKRNISIDLDEENDDDEWNSLENILKRKNETKMKELEEIEQKKQKIIQEAQQVPMPSTSWTDPQQKLEIISTQQGSSWKTWKEERIKSGNWIEDVEEYKRMQEAKGLVKKTFKTKDGKFFTKWVKKSEK